MRKAPSASSAHDIHRVVQAQFGPAATAYGTSAGHGDPEQLAELVRLAEPRPTDLALDIATGAGHVALAFAPHVAHVVAYDLTPQMLEETERRAAARGLGNVRARGGRRHDGAGGRRAAPRDQSYRDAARPVARKGLSPERVDNDTGARRSARRALRGRLVHRRRPHAILRLDLAHAHAAPGRCRAGDTIPYGVASLPARAGQPCRRSIGHLWRPERYPAGPHAQ